MYASSVEALAPFWEITPGPEDMPLQKKEKRCCALHPKHCAGQLAVAANSRRNTPHTRTHTRALKRQKTSRANEPNNKHREKYGDGGYGEQLPLSSRLHSSTFSCRRLANRPCPASRLVQWTASLKRGVLSNTPLFVRGPEPEKMEAQRGGAVIRNREGKERREGQTKKKERGRVCVRV